MTHIPVITRFWYKRNWRLSIKDSATICRNMRSERLIICNGPLCECKSGPSKRCKNL